MTQPAFWLQILVSRQRWIVKNAEAQVQQNNIHDLPFHLHWVRAFEHLRCHCHLRFRAVFFTDKRGWVFWGLVCPCWIPKMGYFKGENDDHLCDFDVPCVQTNPDDPNLEILVGLSGFQSLADLDLLLPVVEIQAAIPIHQHCDGSTVCCEVKCPPDADAVLAMLGGEANVTEGTRVKRMPFSNLESFRVFFFLGRSQQLGTS